MINCSRFFPENCTDTDSEVRTFNIEYPEYPECFIDGIDLKLYYIFAI